MSTVTDRPIRIGVQIMPQRVDYADIRQAVADAEALGVDVAFNWDHFFPLGANSEGKHFECWTMLAAWAESTSWMEIGALVTCNAYRNPDLLADMARTVDHISGGRLILGIGAGFKEREHVEYGYPFGTAGERIDALGASLPRIERRLSLLNPPPMRGIPMLIGGGGESKTLRLVARHADIWHTFAEGEEFARKSRVLASYCDRIGRDPSEIERSVLIGGDPWRTGTELRQLGVSLFTIMLGGPKYDLAEVASWIAWRDEQNVVATA